MMKKCSDFPISDLFDWKKEYGLFWKMFTFNFLYSLANLAFALLTTTLLISGGELIGLLTPQEIVALYTVSTFSNILMNLFDVVGPIMVSVSEASTLKNQKLVQNYVMIALKFPIVMVIAVLTFFILFGPEMIELFYGSRWITMGMLIMICLMPSYCMGSFASRYDNILAGIGRPETVIVPWMIALGVALLGMFIGLYFPSDAYLVNDLITSNGETINYGISYRFAFALITTSIALFIGGIWIVKVCLKVLGVAIPAGFIWKPLFVAGITALCVKGFLFFVPLRALLNEPLGTIGGGIAFTVLMVGGGILLFLTFGLLFDVMNKEDGKFWKTIADGMGPARVLLKPLFAYCRWLLNHQVKSFVQPPVQWVLTTDKKTLMKESLFDVKIHPLTKGLSSSERGVELERKQEIIFRMDILNSKVDLFDIIAYAKLDLTKMPATLISCPKISKSEMKPLDLTITIPPDLSQGTHELVLVLEAYEVPRTDITPLQAMNKGWWSYWDFRMRWLHEQEYYIYVK